MSTAFGSLLQTFARLALFPSRSPKPVTTPFPMASALSILATNVSVSEVLSDSQEKADVRPAHHANDSKTHFVNPWPSFRQVRALRWKIITGQWGKMPAVPKDIASLIPVQTPTWGAGTRPDAIKATWLGHACFLVEFPAPAEGVRGPRVLFDPALSHRCSPFSWMGPERITPVPCPIDDIPAVDAIVISVAQPLRPHRHRNPAEAVCEVQAPGFYASRQRSLPRIHRYPRLPHAPSRLVGCPAALAHSRARGGYRGRLDGARGDLHSVPAHLGARPDRRRRVALGLVGGVDARRGRPKIEERVVRGRHGLPHSLCRRRRGNTADVPCVPRDWRACRPVRPRADTDRRVLAARDVLGCALLASGERVHIQGCSCTQGARYALGDVAAHDRRCNGAAEASRKRMCRAWCPGGRLCGLRSRRDAILLTVQSCYDYTLHGVQYTMKIRYTHIL